VSLWWHDYTVSAGASGAIFGLYGVFLAILSTNHVDRSMRNGLLANIGVFVVYNLVYGAFKGGIDNAAHIGGLLGGIVIGYLYIPGLRKPNNLRLNRITLSGVAVITLACSAFGYSSMAKSDRLIYYKRMQEFYNIETKAISIFTEQESKTSMQVSAQLEEGITYWQSGVKLIKELDKLNLSENIHHKNEILVQYCQLRIKSYLLLNEASKRNTSADESKLQAINQQIQSVLDKLK
jgi:rhomboid protease GluP